MVIRQSFEQDFVQALASLPSTALYITLGPMPLAALDWCAERGCLSPDHVLGALAHPSSSSGT